jgi:transposase-like protein
MDVHENARTMRHSRLLMVRRLASGWTIEAVPLAHGVTPRTVRKWRDRHAGHAPALFFFTRFTLSAIPPSAIAL